MNPRSARGAGPCIHGRHGEQWNRCWKKMAHVAAPRWCFPKQFAPKLRQALIYDENNRAACRTAEFYPVHGRLYQRLGNRLMLNQYGMMSRLENWNWIQERYGRHFQETRGQAGGGASIPESWLIKQPGSYSIVESGAGDVTWHVKKTEGSTVHNSAGCFQPC
jgi:hypothetical protein